MIILIIYTDILILVNFLVDYFLLLLTVKLTESKVRIFRVILSAFIGGISSLYIFFPINNILFDLLYKIILSFIMTLTVIGFKKLRQFSKFCFFLFSITSLYAGIIYAVSNVFKPSGMLIDNGVTYFEISPIFICASTVVFYLLITFLSRIFKKSSHTAECCEITLTSDSKSIKLKAIVDTGNSVSDYFGKSEIIIADNSSFKALFGFEGDFTDEKLKSRFRIVPCATVTGEDFLKGYRCDSAVIKTANKTVNIEKPILAQSKTELKDGYNAIVNPKILL